VSINTVGRTSGTRAVFLFPASLVTQPQATCLQYHSSLLVVVWASRRQLLHVSSTVLKTPGNIR
jgi:hypothetical protein